MGEPVQEERKIRIQDIPGRNNFIYLFFIIFKKKRSRIESNLFLSRNIQL